MKRLIVLITTLLCLAVPASVYAYSPLTDACGAGGSNGGAGSTSACTAKNADPISGKDGVLRKVSFMLAIFAGIAAVIVIIFSGFQYVTSDGDAQKAANARSGIIGAVIGLVIIAVAQTIVIFVVSKL
jgi:heme/copper-type cytochrome/quinol oxidase subunit 2